MTTPTSTPAGPMAAVHARDSDPYEGMRQRRQRTVYEVSGTPAEGAVESGAFFTSKPHPAQPLYAQPRKENGKFSEKASFIATSKPGRGTNGFIPVMRTVPCPGGKYLAPERRLNAGDVCFVKGRSHEVYRRLGWTMDRSQSDGDGDEARDLFDQQPDRLHNFSFIKPPPSKPISDVTTVDEAKEWKQWFEERAKAQREFRERNQAAEDLESRYSARNSRFMSTALSTDATVASLDEVRSALDALVVRRADGKPARHAGSKESAPTSLGMIVLRSRTLALEKNQKLKVSGIPETDAATKKFPINAQYGSALLDTEAEEDEEQEQEGEGDGATIGAPIENFALLLLALMGTGVMPSNYNQGLGRSSLSGSSSGSSSGPPSTSASNKSMKNLKWLVFKRFLDTILGPRQPDASNALRNYLLTIREGHELDANKDIPRPIYGAWLSEPVPKSAASGQLVGGTFLDPIQLASHIVQALGYTPDGVVVWSDEQEMVSGHFTRDALAYNVAVQGVVSVNNGVPCPDSRRPADRTHHGRSMEPLGNLAQNDGFLTNADLRWFEHRRREIPMQSFDPLVRVRDQLFIGMYCATAEDDVEPDNNERIRRSADTRWTSKTTWMRWFFDKKGKQQTARWPEHAHKLRFFLKPLSSRQLFADQLAPEDAAKVSNEAMTRAMQDVRDDYATNRVPLPPLPPVDDAGQAFVEKVKVAFDVAFRNILKHRARYDLSADDMPDPDMHLLVGAWQIGSVMDSRAARPAYDNPVAREFGGKSAAFPTTKVTACVNVQWVDAFQLRYRYGTSATHWSDPANVGGTKEDQSELDVRGVTAAATDDPTKLHDFRKRSALSLASEVELPYDARPRFWPLHDVDKCLEPARDREVAAKWTNQAIAMEMVERNIHSELRRRT